MTAFAGLREDYDRVRTMFDRFEELGPRNHPERKEILGEIREAFGTQRDLEREILHPAARRAGVATEAEQGHRIVDRLLAELDEPGVEDRRFSVVFAVLRENVEQHIREEERDVLTELDRRLDPQAREILRRAIEERLENARSAAR